MAELFLSEILPVILGLLGSILAALIVWGFRYLIGLVKVKVVEEALKIAKEETRDVVLSLFAQLKSDVKEKAREDGLDREDVEQIKQNAINKLKRELPTVVKKILDSFIDDFDGLLGDWVYGFLELDNFLQ